MANFWTKEKIEILKSYLEIGMNNKDIALKMNTTYDAVGNAAKRYNLLGLRKAKPAVQKMIENVNLEELKDDNFEQLKKEAVLQWSVKKSKIVPNKKKDFKTYLIVGDIHCPKHNTKSLNSVFKLMDDVKFDGIINIGDFMDFSCISHHNKGKNKTLEGLRLKNDYIVGNIILDEFDKRLPKNAEKHYLLGNHEQWLEQLIEESPVLDGLFDLDTCLKLKERGYKVYPYNDIVKFGRLNIVHGLYTGSNVAKQHATKLLGNALVGHVHSPEMALIHSPSKECSVVGYVNGCLCDMAPDYLKGKPNQWANGFAIFTLFNDDYFDVNLIRIVKNRYVYNGKVYNGAE